MFIDINTLGPEGLAFDRQLCLRGIDGPSRERFEEVSARLWGSVTPTGSGGASLAARLEAQLALTCSRCLEPFDWKARSAFELTIVRRIEEREEPEAPPADDPSTLYLAPEGKIEFEAVAVEQLYLELPLKPICTPACRGLCPRCGVNRNLETCACTVEEVDPRLAPLLPFRQKKTQES